jgi:hypothetical protein
VELDRPLGLPESSPGEDSKAELDGGGIEEIDLSFELELMLGSTRLAALQQLIKHLLVEVVRLSVVYSGKSSPAGWLHTQVIDPLSLRGKIANQVTKAFSATQLCDHHGKELTPPIEGAEFVSSMMSVGQIFKIMSWEKCGKLIEYCVTMRHGSDLLVIILFSANSL